MMKRLLFLSAIVTLSCWATGTAQTETGTARGPFSDKLPEDDLAIVSYHVEERIATIYGPHITTYNVQDPRYISRIELGPGNVRLIVPKFAKIRKREPSLVVTPAKVATGSVLPSTSTELAARALPSGAVHKAGYAYINIIRTYERILAKGYKSVDMLKKVADQRFFDGDLEIAAGWYAKLFWDPSSAVEVGSVVADVHTQPTDEAGNPVGKVLHVGTWFPREMVVTVESCSGPRAYVGLVSSYHEQIKDNFVRMTDDEWRAQGLATPPDVSWFSGLVAH